MPPHLNNGCTYRELLGPAAEGRMLLDYLANGYGHSTKEEWTGRIEAGLVRIDGLVCGADALLKSGSTLAWERPPWIEPEAPRSFVVLYEDDDLVAVEKPAGLPTLPGANFLENTLLHLLREHRPDASPLHRLGRWTSGIVLAAKNQRSRADLTRQWSMNSIEKTYRALASGSPPWRETTIMTPIGPMPHELLGSIHAASSAGKAARSHVVVIEQRAAAFLCDVQIATGRPHQIRIHLAAAGHPLVGDPLYGIGGLPLPGTRALPGDPGYLLHASRLAFRHPATGEAIAIVCEPPDILRRSGHPANA